MSIIDMILFSNFRNFQTIVKDNVTWCSEALFKVEKEIKETSIFKGRLTLLLSLLLPQMEASLLLYGASVPPPPPAFSFL
jgi:hypothetical protein